MILLVLSLLCFLGGSGLHIFSNLGRRKRFLVLLFPSQPQYYSPVGSIVISAAFVVVALFLARSSINAATAMLVGAGLFRALVGVQNLDVRRVG